MAAQANYVMREFRERGHTMRKNLEAKLKYIKSLKAKDKAKYEYLKGLDWDLISLERLKAIKNPYSK